MKRGGTFLVAWCVTLFLFTGLFLPARPGRIPWFVDLFVAGLPLGAFIYARYPAKSLGATIVYGLIGGTWFSLVCFDDPRPLAMADVHIYWEAARITSFVTITTIACIAAFILGKKQN
ncbi:MAG: hypothetical protein JWM04_463 [Verrucomicrobiales bacterium]|nr:hypothetical protein [Verrucomicrobiales bacterium]